METFVLVTGAWHGGWSLASGRDAPARRRAPGAHPHAARPRPGRRPARRHPHRLRRRRRRPRRARGPDRRDVARAQLGRLRGLGRGTARGRSPAAHRLLERLRPRGRRVALWTPSAGLRGAVHRAGRRERGPQHGRAAVRGAGRARSCRTRARTRSARCSGCSPRSRWGRSPRRRTRSRSSSSTCPAPTSCPSTTSRLPPGEYGWTRFPQRLGVTAIEAPGSHEANFTRPAELTDAFLRAVST